MDFKDKVDKVPWTAPKLEIISFNNTQGGGVSDTPEDTFNDDGPIS